MDLRLPPQPRPDIDSDPFWQAAAEGRLALCRCTECRLWHQPPLEACRNCGAATRFEDTRGRGSVFSFIVVRHPAVPGFLEDLPYTVGLVELDEQPGLRLPARLIKVAPQDVHVGIRVRAAIEALPGGDYSVAVFEPDAG